MNVTWSHVVISFKNVINHIQPLIWTQKKTDQHNQASVGEYLCHFSMPCTLNPTPDTPGRRWGNVCCSPSACVRTPGCSLLPSSTAGTKENAAGTENKEEKHSHRVESYRRHNCSFHLAFTHVGHVSHVKTFCSCYDIKVCKLLILCLPSGLCLWCLVCETASVEKKKKSCECFDAYWENLYLETTDL